jgi:hypothetical protein
MASCPPSVLTSHATNSFAISKFSTPTPTSACPGLSNTSPSSSPPAFYQTISAHHVIRPRPPSHNATPKTNNPARVTQDRNSTYKHHHPLPHFPLNRKPCPPVGKRILACSPQCLERKLDILMIPRAIRMAPGSLTNSSPNSRFFDIVSGLVVPAQKAHRVG